MRNIMQIPFEKKQKQTLYTSYLPLPGHIQCHGRVQMSDKHLNPQMKLNWNWQINKILQFCKFYIQLISNLILPKL